MATRRLRPEDWAPVPQTRIQIRATPSREPRDERAKFPNGVQKPSRPTPINYPPGEALPIPNGFDTVDYDSPLAPEVVDFAAPGTWPRRGLPPHIVYQQQQWGAKRVGSPSSFSQHSSRQSEMSFGILDYYTRDPSPTRSSMLPPTPNLPQIAQGPPKIGTPVIDPAMEKFDFGLPLGALRLSSQACTKKAVAEPASIASDVNAGAQQQDQDGASQTAPIPPPKTDKVESSKTMYSFFPKDTTPSRPLLTQANRLDSLETHETASSSNISSIPSRPQPGPSYRPRKESLTSSLRSRKDSFTGYRANAQRIPLRILSTSSTCNTNSSIYTTPRTSNAISAPATINTRTSSSTASPPDSANSRNARSQSRWSEDTISSPVAALQGRRTSFGSLLRSVDDERQSEQYPACFFEDDDDEVVPLRRKLQWGRSVSLQSQQQMRKGGVGSGEWEGQVAAGRSGGWKKWVLCGCGG